MISKCNNLHIFKEIFVDKHAKNKNYHEARDHCHYTGEYRGATYSISDLKYSISKQIPIIFDN